MTCYSPLKGWQSKELTALGKRKIVFKPSEAHTDHPIEIPCGQCWGCRLERSRQWAIRCVHEASLHEKNCFITLTYNDENLPPDGSLNLEDIQKFFKRLRKKYKVRFFQCGEYGESLSRPHHHACLFGHDFTDKTLYQIRDNVRLYRSDELNRIWGKGFCVIGDVTFQSAAYVARYIMKKINGPPKEEHYNGLKPEYVTMSRNPGLAKKFFDKYNKNIYKNDHIILNGKKMRPPKFYDSLYDVQNPEAYRATKWKREDKAQEHASDLTQKRLMVRAKVHKEKIKKLTRGLEDGN